HTPARSPARTSTKRSRSAGAAAAGTAATGTVELCKTLRFLLENRTDRAGERPAANADGPTFSLAYAEAHRQSTDFVENAASGEGVRFRAPASRMVRSRLRVARFPRLFVPSPSNQV